MHVSTRRGVCHVRELCRVTGHLCRRKRPVHTCAHAAQAVRRWIPRGSCCCCRYLEGQQPHSLGARRLWVWPPSVCSASLCCVLCGQRLDALLVAAVTCHTGLELVRPPNPAPWDAIVSNCELARSPNPAPWDAIVSNRGGFSLVGPSFGGSSPDDKYRDALREVPRGEVSWMVASCGWVSTTSKALMKAE